MMIGSISPRRYSSFLGGLLDEMETLPHMNWPLQGMIVH